MTFFVSVALVAALAPYKFFYNLSLISVSTELNQIQRAVFSSISLNVAIEMKRKGKEKTSTKSSEDSLTALNFGLF